MICSQVGLAVSEMLWGVSYSFSLFLVARVICGLTKGSTGIVAAVVTDCSPREHRAKGMVCLCFRQSSVMWIQIRQLDPFRLEPHIFTCIEDPKNCYL